MFRSTAGAYTLWTLPTQSQVQFIINRETGQWGTGYQARQDIARVAMEVDMLEEPVEQFTIGIDTASSRLVMEWGTVRWSAPLEGWVERRGSIFALRHGATSPCKDSH